MAQTDAKSGSTKRILFLFVLIVAVAIVVAGYVVKDRKAPKKIITNGDPAPDFRLTSTDGRTISLADLRGKVVMVHFWATWCPPCVEEIPSLDRLNRSLGGQDFAVLAVSVDEGGAPAVSDFLKRQGLTLPVLLNPDRSVATSYGTLRFPETYLIDRG